jgi:hypothetical protein
MVRAENSSTTSEPAATTLTAATTTAANLQSLLQQQQQQQQQQQRKALSSGQLSYDRPCWPEKAGGTAWLLWLVAGLVVAVSLILKQPSHFPVTVSTQSWPPTFSRHQLLTLALQQNHTQQHSSAQHGMTLQGSNFPLWIKSQALILTGPGGHGHDLWSKHDGAQMQFDND